MQARQLVRVAGGAVESHDDERSYDNNAAAVRLRLTRPNGVPRVRVLRSCEGSERC